MRSNIEWSGALSLLVPDAIFLLIQPKIVFNSSEAPHAEKTQPDTHHPSLLCTWFSRLCSFSSSLVTHAQDSILFCMTLILILCSVRLFSPCAHMLHLFSLSFHHLISSHFISWFLPVSTSENPNHFEPSCFFLTLVRLDVSVLVNIYNAYADSLRLASKRVIWFGNAFPKQISTDFTLLEFQRKKHSPRLGHIGDILKTKDGELMNDDSSFYGQLNWQSACMIRSTMETIWV